MGFPGCILLILLLFLFAIKCVFVVLLHVLFYVLIFPYHSWDIRIVLNASSFLLSLTYDIDVTSWVVCDALDKLWIEVQYMAFANMKGRSFLCMQPAIYN